MNLNEQFEQFLAGLGVEMEHSEPSKNGATDTDSNGDALPEITIHQASRDHYGVFYRLDLIAQRPELRIMIPANRGPLKMDTYLVRLSERTVMNNCFQSMANYRGSEAYEQGRDATLQHLLYAAAEMMKQLFWSGDLQQLQFPPEIEVYPLALSEEMS